MTTGNYHCTIHGWTTFTDEITGKMECVRCLSMRNTAKDFATGLAKHFLEGSAEARKK